MSANKSPGLGISFLLPWIALATTSPINFPKLTKGLTNKSSNFINISGITAKAAAIVSAIYKPKLLIISPSVFHENAVLIISNTASNANAAAPGISRNIFARVVPISLTLGIAFSSINFVNSLIMGVIIGAIDLPISSFKSPIVSIHAPAWGAT